MKLYHGTCSADEIIDGGFTTDLVFLTPSLEMALAYGDDAVEVEVDDYDLMVDLDQGSRGVSVETANIYYGETRVIEDYININHSLCCNLTSVKSVVSAF
jgi:hypothetical protein